MICYTFNIATIINLQVMPEPDGDFEEKRTKR